MSEQVYLLRCSGGPLHKIGRTNNLPRRLSQLKQDYGWDFTPIGSIALPSRDMSIKVERWLHECFEDSHHVDELFKFDEGHVRFWLDLAPMIERNPSRFVEG